MKAFWKPVAAKCFIETISRFVKGKGKSHLLEDIWRELRCFDVIAMAKDGRFVVRPTSSVCCVKGERKLMEMMDARNMKKEGATTKTINAAVAIRFQNRVLVS